MEDNFFAALSLPPPPPTLSFELSLTGICCLISGFSILASFVVLSRFRLDTDDPAEESVADC